MKTFMFPGQGSQSRGMGNTLFDQFAGLTASADAILGYSIKTLCLEDPKGVLDQTRFTQPALYVVNALSYYKKIAETGEKPDFLLGHSLGEFNALLAAECFSFEDGLKLVKKRGELMGEVSGGGMAAVTNASKEEIESILAKNGLMNVDLANYNSGAQIVISGMKEDIARAEPLFEQAGMRYHVLNTSGAFHSRFMAPLKDKFAEYLKTFVFADLKIAVISNVGAQPYRNDQVMVNLSGQMASAVKWVDSIHYLLAGDAQMTFEEIGHGHLLTRMVAKIQREVAEQKVAQEATASIETPSVEAQVNAWNADHGIGTKVKSLAIHEQNLQTRTAATLLFGHRAAVYIKGYKGYFDLNEITAL